MGEGPQTVFPPFIVGDSRVFEPTVSVGSPPPPDQDPEPPSKGPDPPPPEDPPKSLLSRAADAFIKVVNVGRAIEWIWKFFRRSQADVKPA